LNYFGKPHEHHKVPKKFDYFGKPHEHHKVPKKTDSAGNHYNHHKAPQLRREQDGGKVGQSSTTISPMWIDIQD